MLCPSLFRNLSAGLLLFVIVALTAYADPSTFNIRQFGAKGDGVTLDTAAIQSAIDACTAAGGGTVVVPSGTFLTGTLMMKSNVTLDLAATAILLGSTNTADYSAAVARCGFVTAPEIDTCLIYAGNAENVTITGSGTIDGQGQSFPARLKRKLLPRPMLMRCFDSRRILVEKVTLKNAGSWCAHFRECSDVRVSGVTILNRVNGNNDGIDLMSTARVRISDCVLLTGDDSICLQDMSDTKPTEDIVITNCIMSTRWAALRSGGAHRAGIRNVTMSNCVIKDTYGCGIKLQISGNGSMENMTFSNIVMENVSTPISLRFGNAHYNNDHRDPDHPWGVMRNMMFDNIWASIMDEAVVRAQGTTYPNEVRQCVSICGIPGHPIEGITLSNLHFTFPGGGTKADAANVNAPELEDQYPEYYMWGILPAYGLYARHARDLTLNNVRFELRSPDLRPAVVCDDVHGFDVNGLRAHLSQAVSALVKTRNTSEIFIQQSRILGEKNEQQTLSADF